jgi:hypothetical protein
MSDGLLPSSGLRAERPISGRERGKGISLETGEWLERRAEQFAVASARYEKRKHEKKPNAGG